MCEGELTPAKITHAMQNLSSGKTPGSDGLLQEFYVKFGDLLGPILVKIYRSSFENNHLSNSMQGSVTRLLFKKDDKKDLRNWQPISLLNVDYKISSKALTARLLKVLPSLTHGDQTCSVPGRTIFDNLSLLCDTLDNINITEETGILLNLDQEKAFDRVNRAFLAQVLRFGFGPDFQHWVSTLYSGANMKVIVNGFLTEEIILERSEAGRSSVTSTVCFMCCSFGYQHKKGKYN